MKVSELAKDLRVDSGELVRYLRVLKVPVGGKSARLLEGDVHKVRARLEQERRRMGDSFAKIVRASLKESGPAPTRRRISKPRRRVAAQQPTPEGRCCSGAAPTPIEEATDKVVAEAPPTRRGRRADSPPRGTNRNRGTGRGARIGHGFDHR